MIRVAIVDDQPPFRRHLRAVLDEETDIEVVVSTDDPAVLEAGEFEVATVDPFADRAGASLQIVRRLSELVPVLAISSADATQDVLAAMRSGASDYLQRETAPAVIVTAVRRVAGGEFYLSARVADALRGESDGRAGAVPAPGRPAAPLARREQEVLSLIARGFTHQQAATRLGTSPATVDTYVARIRTKLGLGPRAAALGEALEGLGAGPDFEPSELEAVLTPRELELVSLIGRGFTYVQVAARLGIPVGAVAPLAARVSAKLGRHAALAAVARGSGLTPPDPAGGRPVPGGGPMGAAPPGPDPAAEDKPPWEALPPQGPPR